MTTQKFTNLLLYPHSDEKPEMGEVERLIIRYPYCQSFHILKAKMQGYTNHTDAELSLNRAATYATDRTYLYHVMKNLHTPKSVEMPEQIVDLTNAFDEQILILEEPPMSEFEILIAPVQHTTSSTLSAQQSSKTTSIETTSATEPLVILPIEEIELPLEETNEVIASPIEIFDIPNVTENTDNQEIITPEIEEIIEETAIETAPKITATEDTTAPDFIQWLSNLEAPEVQPIRKKRKVKKVKKAPPSKPMSFPVIATDKGKRLKKLIEKSIASNDSIASETLAELLVLQGKKKKAIKMYQQLSLKFPEKNAYFAAQIEKLME